MVADAPRFFEVAKKVVELTQDCLFVAHNVNFDYQFVRNEFKRLGYSYERDKLCTVQLSRKLIPGMASYSLGKLCSNLHITIEGRHRAGGHALAPVKLFELLLPRSKAVSFPTAPRMNGSAPRKANSRWPRPCRITSYNVCYTKLLRWVTASPGASAAFVNSCVSIIHTFVTQRNNFV